MAFSALLGRVPLGLASALQSTTRPSGFPPAPHSPLSFAFSRPTSNGKLPFLSHFSSWCLIRTLKHVCGPGIGSSSKVTSFQPQNFGPSENDPAHGEDGISHDNYSEDFKLEASNAGSSLLAKLAIALGLAATVTVLSLCLKKPSLGSVSGTAYLVDTSQALPVTSTGFTFKLFSRTVVLPEYAPGWVYFWLLMAAGCGLFISEEALTIWVGTSLARTLTVDGTLNSFVESFSINAPYIISTVIWVYWGVCISDMIPFYLGKLFRQTKASEDVCAKLGVGKEKVQRITRAVQRYGNLIGFVERFSIGVRNPTSFLAGMLGIPSDCFFAGVCCGGLITLSIQLAIGFLLRERPLVAVASVAAAVGIWTVFPYLLAASTALFLFLRRKYTM